MANDVLWQSFSNANRAAKQLSALWAEIEEIMSGGLAGSAANELFKTTQFATAADNTISELSDKEGWVYHYFSKAWMVKTRSKSTRLSRAGHVTFAVSLWREEEAAGALWEGGNQSKFYVAYCPDKDDWWDKELLWLNSDGANTADGELLPIHSRLWGYKAEGGRQWRERNFFFCMPILKLESREDLLRHAVFPFLRLLSGSSADDALQDTICLLAPTRAQNNGNKVHQHGGGVLD